MCFMFYLCQPTTTNQSVQPGALFRKSVIVTFLAQLARLVSLTTLKTSLSTHTHTHTHTSTCLEKKQIRGFNGEGIELAFK
jgi:hypothetical protein